MREPLIASTTSAPSASVMVPSRCSASSSSPQPRPARVLRGTERVIQSGTHPGLRHGGRQADLRVAELQRLPLARHHRRCGIQPGEKVHYLVWVRLGVEQLDQCRPGLHRHPGDATEELRRLAGGQRPGQDQLGRVQLPGGRPLGNPKAFTAAQVAERHSDTRLNGFDLEKAPLQRNPLRRLHAFILGQQHRAVLYELLEHAPLAQRYIQHGGPADHIERALVLIAPPLLQSQNLEIARAAIDGEAQRLLIQTTPRGSLTAPFPYPGGTPCTCGPTRTNMAYFGLGPRAPGA